MPPRAALEASQARATVVGAVARDGLNILLYKDDHDAARRTDAVARRLERDGLRIGPEGALAGVPVVVKDNIATTALPTSCASRILEGYVSPYDATAVARLERAGAIVVAKIQHGRVRDGFVDRAQRVRAGA